MVRLIRPFLARLIQFVDAISDTTSDTTSGTTSNHLRSSMHKNADDLENVHATVSKLRSRLKAMRSGVRRSYKRLTWESCLKKEFEQFIAACSYSLSLIQSSLGSLDRLM